MLADTIDAYRQREKSLISDFRTRFGFHLIDHCLNEVNGGVIDWVERQHPRKYVIASLFIDINCVLSNLKFP